MRITQEEKQATRQRIINVAVELFRTKGFDATSTRDIARDAAIATGTLFNYFDTKESIVFALSREAITRAHSSLSEQPITAVSASLEEDLFALVAAELRQLKPLRRFFAPVVERSLSPLVTTGEGDCDLRAEHLELVVQITRHHGHANIAPVALQMYWALYMGVLAFWAVDKSPKQEDTLALLDESMQMFATWLRGPDGKPQPEGHES